MSFELAVGVPVSSFFWRSEREEKSGRAVLGEVRVDSGV